jgi:hypothetical protein
VTFVAIKVLPIVAEAAGPAPPAEATTR